MRSYLIIVLLSICFQLEGQEYKSLNDQSIEIESLKKIINTTKSDSLKCITYFKIALIYKNRKENVLAKDYHKKAIELIGKNKGLSDLSYYYCIDLTYEASDTIKFRYADKLLKKYKSKEIYALRSNILFKIALIYQRLDYPSETIKILIKEALPIAIKSESKKDLSNVYKLVSVVFYNQEDIIKASQYLNLSIKELESSNENSNEYFEDLIELYLYKVEILSIQKKINEAFVFLNKSQKILDKKFSNNGIIEFYFSKGSLYQEIKDYNNALLEYDKGIKLSKAKRDSISIDRFKLMKFDVYMLQKKFFDAKDILLNVLSNKKLTIKDRAIYSNELSKLYKEMKDYPNALKYSEQYSILKDSLNKKYEKNKVIELEAKFNNSEKEKKIIALESEKQKAEFENENNKLYLLLLCITFILMLSIIYFLYRNSKIQKKIAFQQEINFNQNLSELKKEKEIEIMRAMINSEEEERKRIARDLHDGIGSRLSSLKMCLGQINNEEKFKNEFEYLSELLSTSIVELRQVSFNLMPETLLRLGLVSAIKDLCYTLNNDIIEIEFNSNGIKNNIAISCQIAIFRIVQELLINALKHSHCTELMIDCSQNDNLFLITIEDNGVGFNVNAINEFKGLGLKNIQNRVDLLNGKFEIVSKNNHGTSINIELIISKS
ncbi:MAG: sensor histidine kinase [Bacteroidetes bacterium]|nr:sensor histidine kinase [Bacteroidota bacterium]